MSAYRNCGGTPSADERRLDMEEYEKFKDFLPNKRTDPEQAIKIQRISREKPLWAAWRDILTRAWGTTA